jgi:integrase
MIFLMASAGLRIGALPILRIKDLEPNDKYNIFRISVYAKSKKSSYTTWCTPECRRHLETYLEHRERWGEHPTDDSPLFRTEYNTQAVDREVKPISTKDKECYRSCLKGLSTSYSSHRGFISAYSIVQ